MLIKYFLSHHRKEMIQIMKEDDESKHYSLNINFLEFFDADTNLGNNLLKHPESILKECDSSLRDMEDILSSEVDENFTIKHNLHARFYDLPICPDLHRNLLPGNEDLGLFLQISGTVVRITLPKMLEYRRQYFCTRCKHKIDVEADFEQKYAIVSPKRCTNPELCRGTTFVVNENADITNNCKDYQEIKIQEQLSKLGMGRMPGSMWVTLEDDLVDMYKPGDSVTICGIVKRRWKPLCVDKETKVELVLKANHVQVNNDNTSVLITPDVREVYENFWDKYKNAPLDGRNAILKAVCPEIFGLFIVKLALAVVLAGGTRIERKEGEAITRSDPHLLLVGDPGTGKSQLLRFASKIMARSVLTTGIGSTSAGLTATALMEDGEWQLEGGALVRADGGICCIDEFDSMKKQDRTSIHEAMEQQTISVAKAGVVCKLYTRCTVLAAMNPRNMDAAQAFGMNINIAGPLLSRFDVVLHLNDKVAMEWDESVADYVLNRDNFDDVKQNDDLWNIDLLKQYYIVIKQLNPVLTPEASKILSSYYQAQRIVASRNKARTTVRLLDSLIRLSQGHARLMCHQEVQVLDAVTAVILIEASFQGEASLLALDFNLSADFPDDPRDSQDLWNQAVLEKLDLLHLLD